MPTPANYGVAYVPNGGGGGTGSIQVVHFEDVNGNLLPAAEATVIPITFTGSVSAFRVTSDGINSAALISSGSGAPYHLVQDAFGSAVASLNPAGMPYDLAVAPTAAPTGTPAPSGAAISDAGDLELLGTSTQAIAIAVGGSNGIVAATSINAAPPLFGGYAPFTGGSVSVPTATRENLAVSSTQTNGAYNVLVRGQDLLSYNVVLVSTGYQFSLMAENSTLGTPSLFRGRGVMAFDSTDYTRALLGQVNGSTQLQLITGLPSQISLNSTLTIAGAGTPHSIAFCPNGTYAAVGTDNGIYILTNFGGQISLIGGVLQPTYTGSDGQTHTLSNVASVSFTPDGRYIVALAMLSSASTVGTVVVLPFNQTNGSATPATTPSPGATNPPSQFSQSGLTTAGLNVDSLTVR